MWTDGITDGAQQATDTGILKTMLKATKVLSGKQSVSKNRLKLRRAI